MNPLNTITALLLTALSALGGTDSEFIRVAPDQWGFETSVSKTPFVPFGANFVLSDKRYLNLFDPKVYNKAVYEHGLAALEGLGFNIVKVFLPMGEVLPDPQAPGEARIAPGYLDNLEDFLRCAGGHHIRVVVSLADWGGSGLKWWREGGRVLRAASLARGRGYRLHRRAGTLLDAGLRAAAGQSGRIQLHAGGGMGLSRTAT